MHNVSTCVVLLDALKLISRPLSIRRKVIFSKQQTKKSIVIKSLNYSISFVHNKVLVVKYDPVITRSGRFM